VVTFTSLPLYYRGRSPRYPLDRRRGGPHNRSERCGEEKNLYLSPSQYRLSHPGSLCEWNILKLRNSAQICIGVKAIFIIVIVNKKLSEFLRIVNQQFTRSQSLVVEF
jgi:hypothetical protein